MHARIAVVAIIIAPLLAGAVLAADDYVQIGKDKLWDAPRPDKPDLSVQYIARTPRYPGYRPEYVIMDDENYGRGDTAPIKLEDPDAQRWPKPGETVTFTAVVRNAGARTITAFDWHWLYDGEVVEAGVREVDLVPDDLTRFTLERPWEDGRHFIAFEVDRRRLLDEVSEENNWVVDRTDGLSFAFFVEESVRDYFKTVRNGLGSYDWADWAQFQIRQMNKEFRDTIYPSCPGGIEERVRLDGVYIIPDGWGHKGGMHTPGVRMPVDFEKPRFYNANEPPPGIELQVFDNQVGGVDGVWGFSVDLLREDDAGLHFYSKQHRWITGSEWPLHHELGHQLGRIDNYLIVASPEHNEAIPGLGYRPPADFCDGMMFHGNYSHDNNIGKNTRKWDSTYRFYSEHTAVSFNRDKGKRRGLFGEYLFDVPERNRFVFIRPDGTPVAHTDVQIFVGRGRGYGPCRFNAHADFVGHTDGNGIYSLGRSPWDHIFIWGNNGVVMFRLGAAKEVPLVGFRDISHFNLAYWRGREKSAFHQVVVRPVSEAKP